MKRPHKRIETLRKLVWKMRVVGIFEVPAISADSQKLLELAGDELDMAVNCLDYAAKFVESVRRLEIKDSQNRKRLRIESGSARAARLLGMNRTTLVEKMKKGKED